MAKQKRKSRKLNGVPLLLFLIVPLAFIFAFVVVNKSQEHRQAMAACSIPAPTTAVGYEKLLRNTPINGRWYHGDNGASAKLPNGSVLWVFGDTLSGTMSADGTQYRADQAVNNTATLTTGGCATILIGANGADGKPTAWVKPTGSFDTPNLPDYYWLGHPFMDGNYLRIFLMHMYNDANGFHTIGSDIATFDVSRATPRLLGFSKTPGSASADVTPSWGAAVVKSGDYTYIYGNLNKRETWVFGHYYYLARVPNGKITTPTAWRYWTGSTWSTNQASVQPIISGHVGVGAAITVYPKTGGGFILTAKKNDLVGSDIVAWTAPQPMGPWTEVSPALVAPVPDVKAEAQEYTYLGLTHTHAALSSGKMLVSWSLNSFDQSFFGDPRYGIYFIEVSKP